MTVWFVSRHPGALEWARLHDVRFDRHAAHLDVTEVMAGDTVIGTLPVQLAAEICVCGAEYWNLPLDLISVDRGRELSADELERNNARMERFEVRKHERAT